MVCHVCFSYSVVWCVCVYVCVCVDLNHASVINGAEWLYEVCGCVHVCVCVCVFTSTVAWRRPFKGGSYDGLRLRLEKERWNNKEQ